jgi:uncharacterized protein YciI
MDTPDTERRPHRYLVLVMRLPAFDAAVIEPHRRFLDELRADGLLELQGPFTDKSGGAYLLRATSLARANAIVARDPLVTSGASRVCVYEWAAT